MLGYVKNFKSMPLIEGEITEISTSLHTRHKNRLSEYGIGRGLRSWIDSRLVYLVGQPVSMMPCGVAHTCSSKPI